MRVFLKTIVIVSTFGTPLNAFENHLSLDFQVQSGRNNILPYTSFPQTERVEQELEELKKRHKEAFDDTFRSRTIETLGVFFSIEGAVFAAEKAFKYLSFLLGAGKPNLFVKA